jgi:hypothetical protein
VRGAGTSIAGDQRAVIPDISAVPLQMLDRRGLPRHATFEGPVGGRSPVVLAVPLRAHEAIIEARRRLLHVDVSSA